METSKNDSHMATTNYKFIKGALCRDQNNVPTEDVCYCFDVVVHLLVLTFHLALSDLFFILQVSTRH